MHVAKNETTLDCVQAAASMCTPGMAGQSTKGATKAANRALRMRNNETWIKIKLVYMHACMTVRGCTAGTTKICCKTIQQV